MPQLNPQPWFFVLLMVWIIFSVLSFPNVLKTNYPCLPKIKSKSLKNNLSLKIKN